jgi:hypothetical protein
MEITDLLKKANDDDYDPKALEQLKLPNGQTNQEDSPWEVQKVHEKPRLFYKERIYIPNWTSALSLLEFVHNSCPHADRKQSPFKLLYGYQLTGLPHSFSPTKIPNLEERLHKIDQWRKDAQIAHELVCSRMINRNRTPLE